MALFRLEALVSPPRSRKLRRLSPPTPPPPPSPGQTAHKHELSLSQREWLPPLPPLNTPPPGAHPLCPRPPPTKHTATSSQHPERRVRHPQRRYSRLSLPDVPVGEGFPPLPPPHESEDAVDGPDAEAKVKPVPPGEAARRC